MLLGCIRSSWLKAGWSPRALARVSPAQPSAAAHARSAAERWVPAALEMGGATESADPSPDVPSSKTTRRRIRRGVRGIRISQRRGCERGSERPSLSRSVSGNTSPRNTRPVLDRTLDQASTAIAESSPDQRLKEQTIRNSTAPIRHSRGGVMLYPVNAPGLVRRNLNGAFANDPTIPYSPSRARRLAGTVRSIARRSDRDAQLSRAGAATATDAC
jgi:hypothetical protein